MVRQGKAGTAEITGPQDQLGPPLHFVSDKLEILKLQVIYLKTTGLKLSMLC